MMVYDACYWLMSFTVIYSFSVLTFEASGFACLGVAPWDGLTAASEGRFLTLKKDEMLPCFRGFEQSSSL